MNIFLLFYKNFVPFGTVAYYSFWFTIMQIWTMGIPAQVLPLGVPLVLSLTFSSCP